MRTVGSCTQARGERPERREPAPRGAGSRRRLPGGVAPPSPVSNRRFLRPWDAPIFSGALPPDRGRRTGQRMGQRGTRTVAPLMRPPPWFRTVDTGTARRAGGGGPGPTPVLGTCPARAWSPVEPRAILLLDRGQLRAVVLDPGDRGSSRCPSMMGNARCCASASRAF